MKRSSLLGQKYAQAEPLLIQAYEGLKARKDQLQSWRKRLVDSQQP